MPIKIVPFLTSVLGLICLQYVSYLNGTNADFLPLTHVKFHSRPDISILILTTHIPLFKNVKLTTTAIQKIPEIFFFVA